MPFHAKGRGLLRKMDTTSKAATGARVGEGSAVRTEGLLCPAEEAWLGGGRASRRAWWAAPSCLGPRTHRGWPGFSVQSSVGPRGLRRGWSSGAVCPVWPGAGPQVGGRRGQWPSCRAPSPHRPGAWALRQVDESPCSATSLPPRPIL